MAAKENCRVVELQYIYVEPHKLYRLCLRDDVQRRLCSEDQSIVENEVHNAGLEKMETTGTLFQSRQLSFPVALR